MCTNKAKRKRKASFPLSWRSVGAAVPEPKKVPSTHQSGATICRGKHVVARGRNPYPALVQHENDEQDNAAVTRTRRRQAVQLYVGNCSAAMNVCTAAFYAHEILPFRAGGPIQANYVFCINPNIH